MWIRAVDVPRELIEAHRAGKLVIFVGAGASLGAPSDLPTFQALTAGIAAEAGVPAPVDQQDRFLGELKDEHGVDVHLRVAAKIGVSSSRPNQLHEAIVTLAATGPIPRIVTTNYDRHLSTVLSSRGVSVTEYLAPALPIGDDFAGLIYLHGSLSQEPHRLVVTDEDFGRAYLRDAWATRFLERMFATYAVLFVGYSHNDVVMSYLARGLGRKTVRFALASDPDASHWRRLRIRTVPYPVVDNSHAALADAVEGWGTWASMGLLDHRQRVAELVSATLSPVPEEVSYLEVVLADSDEVGFFAEFARGPEWLTWAAGQPEFRRLFDPAAAVTDCTMPLARWFAQQYVMNEAFSDAALVVVQEAGGRLGPAVWSAIGQVLHSAKDSRPSWLGPWLVLLIENTPDNPAPWLEYALEASRWPDDRMAALVLFDHLTEPRATVAPSFGLGGSPGFDAARDCLEEMLDGGGDAGPAYLRSWAATDVPLLRRLALHGWTYRGDVDATAKLAWWHDQGWLFDHQLRHEVFRLVETTFADAAVEVADDVVAQAVVGPDDAGEHRDYETYNALVWMTRHAPDLRSARDALDRAQAEHPEFGEREHPDLSSWSEFGFVPPQPPMTAAALHELIENDAAAAIAELRRCEHTTFPLDGPTWDDAIRVLAETVGERPTDGFAVIDADGGGTPGILHGAIRGWAATTVDAGLLGQYLEAARHVDELRDERRRELCEHLAAVAVHSELSSGWLRTFTATVDIRTRTDWMDRVAWQLSRLPVEAVEHQWQRWMRRYWQDRLESVPTQLTVDESSAMASWIVYLADSIGEGVTLATAHTARLVAHSDLLHDLNGDRIAQEPTAFASLVTHLLRGTQPPFYDCYHLAEVVRMLRQQPDPVELSGIIEQALRLGCTGAANW